ncbi:MAG: phosphoribosylformylglycinamidine cyclo-ligase [Chloroflexi bacterium]|nr:phosphoribosylformylglycinamidine cyclo-ligase [Chloroflexota bacterium]
MASQTAETYAAVGVDVDANDRLISRYRQLATTASRREQLDSIGGFSGLFDISALTGYRCPVLASSTDGVGTKVIVASLADRDGRQSESACADRFTGVGRDLVNHCVNDILAVGAEPLFFVDYLASNGVSEDQKSEIVAGVANACRDSGMALIGGETADMPDLYMNGYFDLAGTIIGVLEKGNQITGEEISAGDIVLGLPSSGLHTNGYSLAREVLGLRRPRGDDDDEAYYAECAKILQDRPWGASEPTLADALLEPHRADWSDLGPHLPMVKGMAHITGGGVQGNIERVLPSTVTVSLEPSLWQERWDIPPIFDLIQQWGDISSQEMYRVFNMGIGMAFMASPGDANELLNLLPSAAKLGEVLPAGGGMGGTCRISGIDD